MTKDALALRLRRATEAILEAENLTDGLQDAEAETLLNWGLARVEAAVYATADLDPAVAKAHIARSVTLVRQMMRRINTLVAARADLEEDEDLADGLRALVQAAPDLPKGPEERSHPNHDKAAWAQPDTEATIRAIVAQRFKLSDGQMLQKVLALIDAAAEARS
jgi:hypothetical protein